MLRPGWSLVLMFGEIVGYAIEGAAIGVGLAVTEWLIERLKG